MMISFAKGFVTGFPERQTTWTFINIIYTTRSEIMTYTPPAYRPGW